MAPLHEVSGPCSCGKCGGQLQVKLAKGGKFPGHHYIHCIPCGYHFVFPKAGTPHLVTVSPPPATQGSLTQSRTIDCSKPGCKRRGCTQCLRRMCKQCCVAQSGCSLRAHCYDQLSARQRGKLPEPTRAPQADAFPLDPLLRTVSQVARTPPIPFSWAAPQADEFPLDPLLRTMSQASETSPLLFSSVPFNSGGNEASASLQPIANNLYPSTIDEDQQQYAAAIAASLSMPEPPLYQMSTISQPASAGPSQPAAPLKLHPSTTPLTKVCTIPYRPPNIKQHMSEEWMRPTEDKTKKPKRVVINLDNRFSLVFWHEDEKEPKIRAIHECPVWPKWILVDAVDICEELDIHTNLLEYYDMRSCQWIRCSLSYPHDVKRDGYLLLRLLKMSCLNLEKYIEQANTKAPHLRNNMAGERAAIRQKLQQRKIEPPRFLVSLSDDEYNEVEFVESPRPKRRAEDDVDFNRLTQRPRSQLAGPSTPCSPSPPLSPLDCDISVPFSPISSSSSITTMSPRSASPPSLAKTIYVPEGTRWPDGMYAIDMAQGFHQLDQGGPGVLKAHLFTVFGREIPVSTYRDQRRNWKALTQKRRDELKAAGHVPAGLWSHVPKTKK